MVRLVVEDLIERLDMTIIVLQESEKAGMQPLIEAVVLARGILAHYVKPFSYTSNDDLSKHISELDKK
tara:strand:+ start:1372 stop:1575 length:204 start_codon:yes stop_codon:yes gene_type:complete